MKSLLSLLIILSGTPLFVSTLSAEPYFPESDNEVLEVLDSSHTASANALQTSTEIIAEVHKIFTDLERGADPRNLGRVNPLLESLKAKSGENLEYLLLLAHALQYDHRFDEALAILLRAARLDPRNPQVWLTTSAIQLVIGRFDEARASCRHLLTAGNQLLIATCSASVASMTGDLNKAEQLIENMIDTTHTPGTAEERYAILMLADFKKRLGKYDQAQALGYLLFKEVVPETASLVLMAEIFLAQQRPDEVIQLLKAKLLHDGCLVRYLIACKRSLCKDYEQLRDDFKERIELARLRGEFGHAREYALFALDVLSDTSSSLEFARRGFDTQKEVADVLIYLRAASEAQSANDISRVTEWIESHHLEDVQLQAVMQGRHS